MGSLYSVYLSAHTSIRGFTLTVSDAVEIEYYQCNYNVGLSERHRHFKVLLNFCLTWALPVMVLSGCYASIWRRLKGAENFRQQVSRQSTRCIFQKGSSGTAAAAVGAVAVNGSAADGAAGAASAGAVANTTVVTTTSNNQQSSTVATASGPVGQAGSQGSSQLPNSNSSEVIKPTKRSKVNSLLVETRTNTECASLRHRTASIDTNADRF